MDLFVLLLVHLLDHGLAHAKDALKNSFDHGATSTTMDGERS